jgi:hypothetical protein
VEGNITIGCDFGTIIHTPIVSTSSGLRTSPVLKREGILGSDTNPCSKVII